MEEHLHWVLVGEETPPLFLKLLWLINEEFVMFTEAMETLILVSLIEMFGGIFLGVLIILSDTRHLTWFDEWSENQRDWMKFWFWFLTCGGAVSLINILFIWLFL